VADDKLVLPGSGFTGTVDADQVPAWSADGTKLLIAAPDPGVLTVSTGTFKKLPKSLDGKNFRWSGDGNRLIYGTSSCRLKVADATGTSGRTVPGLGDPETARNPDGTAVCRPLSADPTGGRITAPLVSVGSDGGDPIADAVVDTATGEVLSLPVTGQVSGVLFGPDGNLLVRTRNSVLYVFTPDGTLLVQAKEPAVLQNLELLAYTR
jgi:TolB protein